MADKLLPCPFCGGENVRVWDLSEDTDVVTCDDCNAQGGYFGGSDSTSPDEAIAAWNRRTCKQHEARIEALERDLKLAQWALLGGDDPSENEIALTRREALEEAARAAEEKTAGWFDERAYVGQSIAAAIRALKERE